MTNGSELTVGGAGVSIIGIDKERDKIIYTGTGTFITVTSQNFTMQSVWLSSTNSSSTLIEATDIATSAGSYNFGRSKFLNLINVQYRNIAGNVMDVKGF